jgi:exodeoxyribonuclease VII large subunit
MPSESYIPDMLGGSEEPQEPRVLTVSEVTKAVRAVIEHAIGQVWVKGEVSNYRRQSSGHQYFTLKDETSQLPCVLFARPGMWRKEVAITDGMCVQVRGMLTVYEARGQYQLSVQLIQASGAGLLQAKFDALKRKLDAEGLFDPDRKRALPLFATSVGLVTSPSGAALRDMLNILSRRAPWQRVVISPVRVQGAGAAEEIAAAIAELNGFQAFGLKPVDVIVVTRGGGSAEDLWEFNEEVVARAIAASAIPVISAVGHEIDFTISDFVADLRAPTPSAAAELVAPDSNELRRRIQQREAQIRRCAEVKVTRARENLRSLARTALFREPQARLDAASQRLDLAVDGLRRAILTHGTNARQRLIELAATLRHHRPDQLIAIRRKELASSVEIIDAKMKNRIATCRGRIERLVDLLRLLSPIATLQRGYTLTTTAAGELIPSVQAIPADGQLITRFHDGSVASDVRK